MAKHLATNWVKWKAKLTINYSLSIVEFYALADAKDYSLA